MSLAMVWVIPAALGRGDWPLAIMATNRLHQLQQQVKHEVRLAHLENYDMVLGQLVTTRVDVWLNNPEPPLEYHTHEQHLRQH